VSVSRRFCALHIPAKQACASKGLISQVAQTLWEVKDKKIMDLTKQDITIVEYKKQLAKRSKWGAALRLFDVLGSRWVAFADRASLRPSGQAQIEKAALLSKTSTGGKL
jgi:hypothetical protein